ncbi:DUF2357 domain-containing protein [Variovorax sp. OK202]|uniref:DUF2357 domain-containing protein n=1 Tax=Variovorax sp. OK202 TaxID=1884311 RepID=UPI0008C2C5DF|nr:DUF2357 domain-containing protein [Variovorax sp. OK202]SEK14931.1 protein of unknown function [Variovorax sp. OK202]SFE06474.1 protein of unknown function [Variovorax sp. OK212]
MLRFRRATAPDGETWTELEPGQVGAGLTEDTNYLLTTGSRPDTRIFVDDVELQRESASLLKWRPSFYSGRVAVDIVAPGEQKTRYFLDVSPSPAKSGQAAFDDMVADIRAFDQALLVGASPASMEFGHAGKPGKLASDILLARLREHGSAFLSAVETIASSPHRSLAAEAKVLPLSRIRRLHHSSLQDRRLAAMATGHSPSPDAMDSLQVSSLTSAPTFDTPANRALLALLRRFRAAVTATCDKVRELGLGTPKEEQALRVECRLEDLDRLGSRTHKLLVGPLFGEVAGGVTSSAGLTQIAAQPTYSRAYRLGCRSLSTEVDGSDSNDQLHVAPSWGIYETWCYLRVLTVVGQLTGVAGVPSEPDTVSAERSTSFALAGGAKLEVLFQATFPALKAYSKRSGWSISRERRPDIVLVHSEAGYRRSLVLDAKWRSGHENVLDAMASAHIYHDALRVGCAPPNPCLLLLPGRDTVPELEEDAFIQANNVGAISCVKVNGGGEARLSALLKQWLTSALGDIE